MLQYTHLHVHTDYSLLDGAAQLPKLVQRVKDLGMTAIALTDHGVMGGAIKLIKYCQQHGVKPIVGNEMYVPTMDIADTKDIPLYSKVKSIRAGKKYHLIVLAKNRQGYENLCKLTSLSHLQGWQGGKSRFARPCINKELLRQHSEGLIILSGCLGSELSQLIIHGALQEARVLAKWFKETFGDDYYLEIQDHGHYGNGQEMGDVTDKSKNVDEREVNKEIVKIGQELNIKVLATNDSHFVCEDDAQSHHTLVSIAVNKDFAGHYSGKEWLKSGDEMLQMFDHLPKDVVISAITDTQEVADKVEDYGLLGGDNRMPQYQIPTEYQDKTPLEFLRIKALEGLQERFGKQQIPGDYLERLDHELTVIGNQKFEEYFLVVMDYCQWAIANNIPMGTARGSAGGSLVSYSLRITNIDPIHHGLLFSRFLNEERRSMPDVDSDFCIERRGEVVDYCAEKYGQEFVAQIGTYGTLAPRQALKDVGRALGVPFNETNQVTSTVPVIRGNPTSLKVLLSDNPPVPDIKELWENNITSREWLETAAKLEGTIKSQGVHAAGVVISNVPLNTIVPLSRSSEGKVSTQYDMGDIEALGLLKMDFLGLKNLTIIDKTLKLIGDPSLTIAAINAKDKTFHPEWEALPDDVQRAYNLAVSGDLDGVFQLESEGMRQVVIDIAPTSIDELGLILALYRPGVLDAGLLPVFIRRRKGEEKVTYQHPKLQPILESSFGIPVYQEQIMKMAQEVAGYSLGRADILRRAMGKKKPEVMAAEKIPFVQGCKEHSNIDEELAIEIFSTMEFYCGYSFNASHSIGYAYCTWQTLYLKANYPAEFMAALLSAAKNDHDKIAQYVTSSAIKILPPDINKSGVDFTPHDGNIIFGLGCVRQLGTAAAIIDERDTNGNYKSLQNFIKRNPGLSKDAIANLIYAGAFDHFGHTRATLIHTIESNLKSSKQQAKFEAIGQTSLFDIDEVLNIDESIEILEEFDIDFKAEKETKALGVCLGESPLKNWQKLLQYWDNKLSKMPLQSYTTAVVQINDIRVIQTKKGDSMAFIKIGQGEEMMDGVIFPDAYNAHKNQLMKGYFLIRGKLDERNDKVQLIVNQLTLCSEIKIAIANIADIAAIEQIKNQCRKYPGDLPVLVRYPNGEIGLDSRHWVCKASTVVNIKDLAVA